MSITDHKTVAISRVYQAGPLKVLVHRASSQPLQSESGDLVIRRAARERWIRDTGIFFGENQAHVFLYVYRGICRFEHGREQPEQVEAVGAARLIAVPSGARYRFWVEPERDLELTIVHATGAVCDRWWQDMGEARPRVLAVRRRRELERDLEDLVQHAPSWAAQDRAAALHYFQAFLCVEAGDQTLGLPARSRGDVHADRCRELIDEHFQTYTSVGELAAALDLHPDYLTRAYRARFDTSPADHLRRRKMEQASLWLREGERTVEAIAKALGFSDAFAFSKSFKAYAGLAPQLWRKQFKR
ncbi:MAG: helix-turn-helix transcriptional regulator [Planctomycetes bacterium]|nr:helix-turn-helix transcriptional regulator [Planctomycetota bacterium]